MQEKATIMDTKSYDGDASAKLADILSDISVVSRRLAVKISAINLRLEAIREGDEAGGKDEWA
jgi:hypothetical protein